MWLGGGFVGGGDVCESRVWLGFLRLGGDIVCGGSGGCVSSLEYYDDV